MSTYLLPWGFSAYLQIAEHVLGTEAPLRVAALPGLVKYGVPDEVSAWLMGFGIDTRSLAVRISAAYARQAGEADAGAVRRWLSERDALRLAEAVDATAEELNEIASTLQRTRRPQLSSDLQAGPPLPRDGSVQIDDDPQAALLAASLTEGSQVILIRDYESAIDRNSIRAATEAGEFGQLDPASSAMLAIEVDAGLRLVGVVTGIGTGDGTLAVRLEESPF